MSVNEILLIIVVVVLLTIPPIFEERIQEPFKTYANLAIGLMLLILVWGFTAEGSLPLRIIVTAVVIKNAIKTFKEYNEFTMREK